jgi:hypothetical protein
MVRVSLPFDNTGPISVFFVLSNEWLSDAHRLCNSSDKSLLIFFAFVADTTVLCQNIAL